MDALALWGSHGRGTGAATGSTQKALRDLELTEAAGQIHLGKSVPNLPFLQTKN